MAGRSAWRLVRQEIDVEAAHLSHGVEAPGLSG